MVQKIAEGWYNQLCELEKEALNLEKARTVGGG